MRISCLILFFWFAISSLIAASPPDSTLVGKNEKRKFGWNFGGIPIVAYNSDIGFQFGAQGNLFDYGDSSYYPDFKRSIKVEASYFTKGTSAFQLMYDDKTSLPNGIRIFGDITYMRDRAIDFYGFNGAITVYNSEFASKNSDDEQYISRMFYKQDRKMFKVVADLQQNINGSHFKWIAGLGIYDFATTKVDIDNINKNLDDDKKLPVVETLYEIYCKWGIISSDEKNGGLVTSLRAGISYDTRNIEANPTKGMWIEVMFNVAPAIFSASNNLNYGIFEITHRQYIPIVKNHLTFDYRIAYEGTLFGEIPYFMQPLLLCSYNKALVFDGVGGAKSVRGILHDRIIGSHVVYGNVELRYRFFDFKILRQNFYLTFSPFMDYGGVVVQSKKDEIALAKSQLQLPVCEREDNYKYYYKCVDGQEQQIEYQYDNYFTNRLSDKLHVSYGVGIQLSMNQNFVLSLNYGRPIDNNDGTKGIYFNTGFIF